MGGALSEACHTGFFLLSVDRRSVRGSHVHIKCSSQTLTADGAHVQAQQSSTGEGNCAF